MKPRLTVGTVIPPVPVNSVPEWIPFTKEEVQGSINWVVQSRRTLTGGQIRPRVSYNCLVCGGCVELDFPELKTRIVGGGFTGICKSDAGALRQKARKTERVRSTLPPLPPLDPFSVGSIPWWLPYSQEDVNRSILWETQRTDPNYMLKDRRRLVDIECLNCRGHVQIETGDLAQRVRKGVFCGLCYKCSRVLKGRYVPWKGGRFVNQRGYVELQYAAISEEDHWLVTRPNKRFVLEHRYVMAKHLGRRLLAEETVHHLNGIRSDNRIENLELRREYMGEKHPAGQDIRSLQDYACDILEEYGVPEDRMDSLQFALNLIHHPMRKKR